MKIGIVGYRRHARKHIDLLRKNYKNSQIIIFHPDKNSPEITNNFDDLTICDCIIISSPTNTHLNYVKKLAEYKFNNPIYLEKPGFNSIKESLELEKLQSKYSLNITIGYHFPYDEIIKKLKKIVDDEETGQIISCDLLISKGISYSDWFHDDWRRKDNYAVSHTGLSHLLSIYYFLFEKNIFQKLDAKIFFNDETNSYDVACATATKSKPILKAIFSWGSPLVKLKIQILTANKIILVEDDTLEVRSPRDVFDESGYYINPKKTYSKKILSKGIEPSLNSFLERSKNGTKFNLKLFQIALKIGRTCHAAELIK